MKIVMFGQRGPGDPLGGGIEVVATELAGRMAAMTALCLQAWFEADFWRNCTAMAGLKNKLVKNGVW